MRFLGWLRPRADAGPALPSDPDALARHLISEIAPGIEAALMQGHPLREIREQIVPTLSEQWAGQHGPEASQRAVQMLEQLGAVHFLTPYGRSLSGLPPQHPSRRNRR